MHLVAVGEKNAMIFYIAQIATIIHNYANLLHHMILQNLICAL
ncbi:hypothetical protein [Helicobacter typhlonius]